MTPAYLHAFVQVARSGNFTAASEVLGVSVSSVSKSVIRLEKELGIKLLHRTTRNVSLTGDGQRLYEKGLVLLEQFRQLREEMIQGQAQLNGVLRLNFPATLGRNVMIEPVTKFVAQHPQLKTEVRFDDRLVDLAEEGVDVVARTGRLSDSTSLIVTRFFTYQSVLCASPSFLSQHGMPRDQFDLEHAACIHFQVRSRGKVRPWHLRTGSCLTPARYVFEDLTAICKAAEAGAGIALLPSWSCLEELNSGRLVEILPQLWPEPTPVWLAYHDRRYIAPKIRLFIESMKGFAEEIGSRYMRSRADLSLPS
ncbi:LysR family transcriptional regulator [bacterium]|nr:LysR family transcriptional regulator [bacterium]